MNTETSLSNLGILTKAEHDERQLVVGDRDDGLDRNAFLTLLTTQLQNQNPRSDGERGVRRAVGTIFTTGSNNANVFLIRGDE